MAKHVHAKLMEMYAKDATTSESPWKYWEVYDPEADKWVTLRKNPEWATDKLYRQNLRNYRLRVFGFQFPMVKSLQSVRPIIYQNSQLVKSKRCPSSVLATQKQALSVSKKTVFCLKPITKPVFTQWL